MCMHLMDETFLYVECKTKLAWTSFMTNWSIRNTSAAYPFAMSGLILEVASKVRVKNDYREVFRLYTLTMMINIPILPGKNSHGSSEFRGKSPNMKWFTTWVEPSGNLSVSWKASEGLGQWTHVLASESFWRSYLWSLLLMEEILYQLIVYPIIYKVLYIPGGVGGFKPFFLIIVKLDHFPNFRGENKKYLKAPPDCHVFWQGVLLMYMHTSLSKISDPPARPLQRYLTLFRQGQHS